MSVLDTRLGKTFEDGTVAQSYAKRPPYPPDLYDRLLAITPGRKLALDLGCGPGKIATELAGHFTRVDAVDPSTAMIEAARRTGGQHANIRWLIARAEDARLDGPYDLVTAGASIHWMQHEVVFPKLSRSLPPTGVMAVISGDDASDAPWLEEWQKFKANWLVRVGRKPDVQGIETALESYRSWMDVAGVERFACRFAQSIADFITCQHSRATWARAAMGDVLVSAFDAELIELLQPSAHDGMLHYEVDTTLVWGKPLSHPRDAAG